MPPEAPQYPAISRLTPFLPYLFLLLLVAGTWRRWILPFQDSGRELMTASRIAAGERLYADVAYFYGPLPPLVDAAAFRVFGEHVDVLLALRFLLTLLAIEGLRRLLRLLTGDARAAGVGTSLVVAACFFQRLGGTFLFPYSVGALEASVATWWALVLALEGETWASALGAGALAGLAGGAKLEFFPAALGGVAVALFLRRPRAQAVAGALLAALLALAAWVIPVAILGAATLEKTGFLFARHVPEPWLRLYRDLFWAGGTAETFPIRFWTTILVPTGILAGGALWAARGARAPGLLAGAAFVAAGGASFILPGGGISGLIPFALVGLAVVLVRALRSGGPRGLEPRTAALAATGAAMLPLVLRQPFSLLSAPYSAFTGPLALAVAFALLLRLSPSVPGLLLVFTGVAAAQSGLRIQDVHRAVMRRVEFPRGSFDLQENEATLLEETVEAVRKRTPAGSHVAVFPESGMVLFLADRKNPFRDEQFLPGTQDAEQEEGMIRRLGERKVAAAVIVNRSLHEFGFRLFGAGYLEKLRAEVQRKFPVVVPLGKPDRSLEILPYPARADEGWLLLPSPR